MNMGVPLMTNFGMEMAEKKEQGLVNALLMVAWTSSWMISAAIGGSLIEEYGYTVTMNITVALYILSTITYYSFFRNSETKGKSAIGWVMVRENAQ